MNETNGTPRASLLACLWKSYQDAHRERADLAGQRERS
jgi:hypothetical protein